MKQPVIFFLLITVLVTTFLRCTPEQGDNQTEGAPSLDLLVGTYTSSGSHGIYKIDFDTFTGRLSGKQLIAEASNPSYLAITKDRTKVFSVNENEDGSVSSFKWNAAKSMLERIGEQSSKGYSPCYIELNHKENLLATANYVTGNIAVYPVNKDGSIQPAISVKQHTGNGPVLPNQEGPHAHCVRFSEDGRWLYAVDLGNDKVLVYPIVNGEAGDEKVALELDPGDGPRHLIFHPNKNIAFIINELSSTVVSVLVNNQTGEFTRITKLSTLPKDYKGKNACADIHVSGDGQFLYASNRGHNSIAVFKVSNDGKLEKIATEHVQGNWPRNFTFSPNEKFLLVANQKSNDITVFKRDPDSGLLSFTGEKMEMDQPVCLKF